MDNGGLWLGVSLEGIAGRAGDIRGGLGGGWQLSDDPGTRRDKLVT